MHSLTAPCRGLTWLAAPLAVTLLTSCGAAGAGPGPAGSPAADTTPKADVVELGQATPRLALTYDGGVMVLDGASLELLETVELDGFNRLNPAGDGRHVMISTGSAFKVLDTGSWSEAHGDHAHHYATTPSLTSVEFVADEPGHVVTMPDGRFYSATARESSNPSTLPSLPTDSRKPRPTPLRKLTTVSPSN